MCILSHAALDSYWCQLEFERARSTGKPILPVQLENNLPLPDKLGAYQFADFSGRPPAAREIQKLRLSLHQSVVAASVPADLFDKPPQLFNPEFDLPPQLATSVGQQVAHAIDVALLEAKPNPKGIRDQLQARRSFVLKRYDEAAEFDPCFPDAYVGRGVQRAKLFRYSEAISDCTRAIRLDAHHAEAYNSRGTLRQAVGDYSGAISDYEQSLRYKNPETAMVYTNWGHVCYRSGDYDQALYLYKMALNVTPGYLAALNNRGEVLYATGNFVPARASFEQAYQIAPPPSAYGYPLAGLAITSFAIGDIKTAQTHWQTLCNTDVRYNDAVWVQNKLNWADKLAETAQYVILSLRR